MFHVEKRSRNTLIIIIIIKWTGKRNQDEVPATAGQQVYLLLAGMGIGRGSADFRWKKKMSAPKNKTVASN